MSEPPTQREYWSGKVGDEWAAYAGRIDAMLAPISQAALAAAAFKPGERVLDIGCGAGATSLEIARRVGAGGAVTGVDLSPPLLRIARERARAEGLAPEFIEGDVAEATFALPFDVGFSRFGVMFFDAPVRAFASIRGALRPEGRLAFACWRDTAQNEWATIPIGAIAPMLKAPLPAPDPDAPGPYAFADGAKVERILSEAGWRSVALSSWNGGLSIAGGGALGDIAGFLLRIGPCARAIADQGLDADEAKQRLVERLAPLYRNNAVVLPAACWIVTANA